MAFFSWLADSPDSPLRFRCTPMFLRKSQGSLRPVFSSVRDVADRCMRLWFLKLSEDHLQRPCSYFAGCGGQHFRAQQRRVLMLSAGFHCLFRFQRQSTTMDCFYTTQQMLLLSAVHMDSSSSTVFGDHHFAEPKHRAFSCVDDFAEA